MRILITGITGFAGSHLAEYFLAKSACDVFGTVKWRSDCSNIVHIMDKIHLHECDIRDGNAVRSILQDIKPDKIFHLAAQSYVHFSWKAPQETLTTNIIGEVNLFESVRQLDLDPLILIAGSSEEYGMVLPDEVPIKETNPLRPLSPYGVSKVTQDMLGYQYFKSYGTRIIRTRAFNHTGPRRGKVFATSNFAKQIAEIEKGKREPVIRVGNLSAVRDFTDVRDVVRAYAVALEKGEPGEVYNIAYGKGITIKEMLDILIGLSTADLKTETDKSRLRPSDVELLIGSSEKFQKQTGWKPQIPFETTMKDLLNYWRKKTG